MSTALQAADTDALVEILADQAANSFAGPQKFYRNLVVSADLPKNFVAALAGVWTGDAPVDARALLGWAAAKGTNPKDPKVTVLGAVLKALLPELGLEQRAKVSAILYGRQLFNDAALVERLVSGMQVPIAATKMEAAGAAGEGHGPEIDWHGSEDSVQLQGLLRADPELLDVGFLTRAIARAAGVCRVEVGATGARGTGFLLQSRDLVLTNHHVIDGGADGLAATAKTVQVRFGCMTLAGGGEEAGLVFAAHGDVALVKSSPTAELDYALLRIAPAILEAESLEPAPLHLAEPLVKSALHLLQHPFGGPMKVAFSSDAVTDVIGGRLVQYVSRSAVGSSGAPCFDDDWQVVALHHAERSRAFGVIREGILLSAILPQLRDFLPGGA